MPRADRVDDDRDRVQAEDRGAQEAEQGDDRDQTADPGNAEDDRLDRAGHAILLGEYFSQ